MHVRPGCTDTGTQTAAHTKITPFLEISLANRVYMDLVRGDLSYQRLRLIARIALGLFECGCQFKGEFARWWQGGC